MVALYAASQKRSRQFQHGVLVVLMGSCGKGIQFGMKFPVKVNKFVYPVGILRDRHGAVVHSFMGLFHGAVHGLQRPMDPCPISK